MSVSKERKNLLVLVDEALFSFNKAWFDISTRSLVEKRLWICIISYLKLGTLRKQ